MGNRKYVKLFIGFFIIMLALTVVSRAADSITVAKAYTEKPEQGMLTYNAVANGKIQASDQEYVRAEKNTFVKKIHVGEGQRVEKGDVLFTLDLEGVKEQLLQAGNELAGLKLKIEKAVMDSKGSSGDRAAVENARRALERAKSDSAFNAGLNGGKQMLADKRAVEDAQAALRTAEKQLEEGKAATGIDLELSRLEIQGKERAVKRLQEICDRGGEVVAPSAGTVGDLTAEAGKELTGETLCTLVPDSAEYVLVAELSEENAKYMKIGDEVSVKLEGKNVPLMGQKIRSLQSSDGKTKVTVGIPQGTAVTHGMTASLSHNRVSQSYPSTIPLSALRGSEGAYYVLIVQESNTVLGQEMKAQRVDVTLVEKDGQRAALQETVDGRVIKDSSKPIEEGDRVREVRDEK